MIDYKSLAKTAALSFINDNQPLNTTITKLAEDNNLNPEQIKRVSELSNRAVHQYCLLKTADKNFSFDLADTQKILGNINNNNDSGLISGFSPEKGIPVSQEKLAEYFGVDNYDWRSIEKSKQRDALIEKFAAAIQEIDSRIIYTSLCKLAEIQDVKSQIKQMIAFGFNPEDVRQTLIAADPSRTDEINEVFKTIDIPVKSGSKPTDDVPIILNPEHPVVIKIKNVFSQNDTLHTLANTRKYLDLNKCKLEEAKK